MIPLYQFLYKYLIFLSFAWVTLVNAEIKFKSGEDAKLMSILCKQDYSSALSAKNRNNLYQLTAEVVRRGCKNDDNFCDCFLNNKNRHYKFNSKEIDAFDSKIMDHVYPRLAASSSKIFQNQVMYDLVGSKDIENKCSDSSGNKYINDYIKQNNCKIKKSEIDKAKKFFDVILLHNGELMFNSFEDTTVTDSINDVFDYGAEHGHIPRNCINSKRSKKEVILKSMATGIEALISLSRKLKSINFPHPLIDQTKKESYLNYGIDNTPFTKEQLKYLEQVEVITKEFNNNIKKSGALFFNNFWLKNDFEQAFGNTSLYLNKSWNNWFEKYGIHSRMPTFRKVLQMVEEGKSDKDIILDILNKTNHFDVKIKSNNKDCRRVHHTLAELMCNESPGSYSLGFNSMTYNYEIEDSVEEISVTELTLKNKYHCEKKKFLNDRNIKQKEDYNGYIIHPETKDSEESSSTDMGKDAIFPLMNAVTKFCKKEEEKERKVGLDRAKDSSIENNKKYYAIDSKDNKTLALVKSVIADKKEGEQRIESLDKTKEKKVNKVASNTDYDIENSYVQNKKTTSEKKTILSNLEQQKKYLEDVKKYYTNMLNEAQKYSESSSSLTKSIQKKSPIKSRSTNSISKNRSIENSNHYAIQTNQNSTTVQTQRISNTAKDTNMEIRRNNGFNTNVNLSPKRKFVSTKSSYYGPVKTNRGTRKMSPQKNFAIKAIPSSAIGDTQKLKDIIGISNSQVESKGLKSQNSSSSTSSPTGQSSSPTGNNGKKGGTASIALINAAALTDSENDQDFIENLGFALNQTEGNINKEQVILYTEDDEGNLTTIELKLIYEDKDKTKLVGYELDKNEDVDPIKALSKVPKYTELVERLRANKLSKVITSNKFYISDDEIRLFEKNSLRDVLRTRFKTSSEKDSLTYLVKVNTKDLYEEVKMSLHKSDRFLTIQLPKNRKFNSFEKRMLDDLKIMINN